MNAIRLNDFTAVSHLRYPNVNVFEKYSPLNGVKTNDMRVYTKVTILPSNVDLVSSVTRY